MTAPTHNGGGICPLCRWAQDHGHPHPCITNPQALTILGTTIQGNKALPATLIDALIAHPARPLAGSLGIHGLRPVDRTWCVCQCSPTPSTAPPGAARS